LKEAKFGNENLLDENKKEKEENSFLKKNKKLLLNLAIGLASLTLVYAVFKNLDKKSEE